MLDLYFWTTPNAYKVTLFLEELGLDYRCIPVNIAEGEQFEPAFLKISPNNRIPAMVDHSPLGGGEPLPIFESGAILLYLAEKTGEFLSKDSQLRYQTLQWLFWQMAGLGPMLGQNHHFVRYAPEKIDYAINRYVNESARLYGVLNKQLADRPFITGEYSIADMACYPWIVGHEKQMQKLEDFPHLKKWFESIAKRPATQRAYEKGQAINSSPTVNSAKAKEILFGHKSDQITTKDS